MGPGRARPPSRPCGLCAPPPSCAGCGAGAPPKAKKGLGGDIGGARAERTRARRCRACRGRPCGPSLVVSSRTAPPSISSNGSAPAACRRAASKIHGARDALRSPSWMTGRHMPDGAAGREGNHASTLPPTRSAAAVPRGRPTPQPAPTACVLVPGQEHPRPGGVSKYLLGACVSPDLLPERVGRAPVLVLLTDGARWCVPTHHVQTPPSERGCHKRAGLPPRRQCLPSVATNNRGAAAVKVPLPAAAALLVSSRQTRGVHA